MRTNIVVIVGLLGLTPIAIGDLITARQLFRSLAPLPMLGSRNAWKAAENTRELRRRGITARKTIDGPYVAHLGLEAVHRPTRPGPVPPGPANTTV